jgi:polyribonucleotide nucleotidyltransferase
MEKKEIRNKIIEILEEMPMNMTRDIQEAIIKKKVLQIAIKNPQKLANTILALMKKEIEKIKPRNTNRKRQEWYSGFEHCKYLIIEKLK